MAAVVRLIIEPGTPRPIDGLCDRCLNPALIEIPAYLLTPGGVRQIGRRVICIDCHITKEDQ